MVNRRTLLKPLYATNPAHRDSISVRKVPWWAGASGAAAKSRRRPQLNEARERVDATVAGTSEVSGIHAAGHCDTPACDARTTRASPAPPAGVADLVSRVRSGTVRGPVDGGATSPSHRRASPAHRPDSLRVGAHGGDRGDRHRPDRTDHPAVLRTSRRGDVQGARRGRERSASSLS